LWATLPPGNRKRLVWILGQMLESQMALAASEEQGNEPQG